MPFQAILKECHVLNPYLEPQLKGYVPSHNSKNTSKLIFETSPKLVDHVHSITSKALMLHQYRLALHTSHQAQQASRPPGGRHVPHCATCLETHYLCTIAWCNVPHRQVPYVVQTLYNTGYHLAGWASPLGTTLVQRTILVLLHFIWLQILNHTIAHLQNIGFLNGCLISNVFAPIWAHNSTISMSWFT